jgi:hypothetical protein
VTRSTGTADLAEARVIRDRLVAEIVSLQGQGPVPGDQGPSLAEWMDAWLALRLASGLRSSTVRHYAAKARLYILPALGQIPVRALTAAHVHEWMVALAQAKRVLPRRRGDDGPRLAEETLSPRTVQMAYVVLRAAMEAAMRQGIRPDNPVAAIPRPRAPVYHPKPLTR